MIEVVVRRVDDSDGLEEHQRHDGIDEVSHAWGVGGEGLAGKLTDPGPRRDGTKRRRRAFAVVRKDRTRAP